MRTSNHASVGRRALLVLAVGQVVSSTASSVFGGAFTTADRAGEPPIVPVGWAFSIWGVIEALSIAWAAWGVWAARHRSALDDRDQALIDQLTVPLLVVFAGFSVWIAAAEIEPIWTTLVVFLVMTAALVRAVTIAVARRAEIAGWPRLGRALLWGLLGFYTGWSSIAVWVNLTTAFAGAGAPIAGPIGVSAQLAVLAGATATAVVLLRLSRGLAPYALTVGWAFATAALGAARAGQPGLAVAAGVGLAVAVATTLLVRQASAAPTAASRPA